MTDAQENSGRYLLILPVEQDEALKAALGSEYDKLLRKGTACASTNVAGGDVHCGDAEQ